MPQLNNAQTKANPIFICFGHNTFEIRAEILQFSPVLMATYEQNAHATELLKESDHHLIHLNELLAPFQPISFDEVYTVFYLLNAIYSFCTPRTDGGYQTEHIQPFVNQVLENRNNIFLSNMCLIADTLDIPLLLNPFVGAIFAKPTVVSIIRELENIDSYQAANAESIAQILFNMDFKLFSEPRILTLLEKQYYLKKMIDNYLCDTQNEQKKPIKFES